MEIRHNKQVGHVTEVAAVRSVQRAACGLCGDVITTENGGRRNGSVFLSFERLLDMHMEQRHPNVCVLPASGEHRKAA